MKASLATRGNLIFLAGLVGLVAILSWGCYQPLQFCAADTLSLRIVGINAPAIVKAGTKTTIEVRYLGAECGFRSLWMAPDPPIVSIGAVGGSRTQRGYSCLAEEDCNVPGIATVSLPQLAPGNYVLKATREDRASHLPPPTASITVEP